MKIVDWNVFQEKWVNEQVSRQLSEQHKLHKVLITYT